MAARLREDAYRPRALFERFRLTVLATTDDPASDLGVHAALAADPTWSGRVIPTFRPDRYLEPAQPGWREAVARLGEVADVDTGGYAGYLRALEQRRRYFVAHGATSADHSHADVRTDPLAPGDAARIYRAALTGEVTRDEEVAFRRNMLLEMARMSCEDGLVMTLHPGVRRSHHRPTFERFGADTGHDIPIRTEFTDALRPPLERFGTHPGFHLVVFTVDETVWSRELAPLAGFYPSVYVGVPWWFLDAPDAIRRFRAAVTETAGFSRTSGFVDDTRAFCSIPARHDMSRRVDAGVLARLVAEHRLNEEEAVYWGISAFTGRTSSPVVEQLNEQGGLYTLVSRAGDGDRFEVLSSLCRAHVAPDHDAWLGYFEAPELAAVTITVTEAGYLRGANGGLDVEHPEVQADVEVLRRDPTGFVRTAPARLVAGIAARRRADARPFTLVPCDHTPGNGALAQRVVHDLAGLIDAALAAWMKDSVAVVTTMVDRITPRAGPQDIHTVIKRTGLDDRCPFVSEPFHEWVLSGGFPAARPRWEDAGAIFTDDVTPYEHRKLWLLNCAHALLAYAGSIRGHTTVAEAVADETCRSWLEEWWAVASPRLDQPAEEVAAYRGALLERFANARMHDRLDRITADGSQKLQIRILPVLRAERAAGRVPEGATRVLDWLDPKLGADGDVVAAVVDQCQQLAQQSPR